ncbi:hypothetical protein Xcel_0520 [Xylanimonas cellulosilytica DSM 15894]|uniref:Gp28/Gp37-like domain-containing protein n=1 Tax=Xylanimonas cellulosilytica (strain DSM 15894 / JCM 12276 / CECT 5975 / KCTC 9989 / LMG 20990 / NBRC 107835 / XIL07) TaxID=446471 RepID=D1BW56_XYLCX|nr:siphovirus ReqiPepy6 Gp37-like family protein [Xylanimonas cellulosilytica]ACZ29559.1 hypothetical protein Xcel_0520 [Xylanimonas cellulosilytica DSM 15894]
MSALWEIWPREPDLSRTADPVNGWSQLVLTERDSLPHTWTVTAPTAVAATFLGGGGCILDRDGQQIVSGRLTGATGDLITATLTFEGDKARYWDRLAWPVPTHALAESPSTFGAAHDTRSGARETVLLAYLAANLGATALTARRMTDVTLPASAGRGGSTQISARMDILGDLVTRLAENGGLILDLIHDESTGTPRLLATVTARTDRSDDVVFGAPQAARATSFVSNLTWSIQRPEYTDAVLFAAGDQSARTAALFQDVDAISDWAMHREGLVDYSISSNTAEMTERATTALGDASAPVAVSFDVAQGGDLTYRTDYLLGDALGFELPAGLEALILDNRLREVTTTVRAGQAEQVQLTIGTPGAQSTGTQASRILRAAMRRIANLERTR